MVYAYPHLTIIFTEFHIPCCDDLRPYIRFTSSPRLPTFPSQLPPPPPHPPHILHHHPQHPTIHPQKQQPTPPQPPHKRALPQKLQRIRPLQIQRLTPHPQPRRQHPHPRALQKRRVGEIEGEEDEVPQEVLAGDDFVEGDEGVGLGEEGAGEVAL